MKIEHSTKLMAALRAFFTALDEQEKFSTMEAKIRVIQRRDDVRMIFEEIANER